MKMISRLSGIFFALGTACVSVAHTIEQQAHVDCLDVQNLNRSVRIWFEPQGVTRSDIHSSARARNIKPVTKTEMLFLAAEAATNGSKNGEGDFYANLDGNQTGSYRITRSVLNGRPGYLIKDSEPKAIFRCDQ